MAALLLAVLLAPEGRPLFYWGARPAVVAVPPASGESDDARVTELHAALDGADLVLKFTFDRPVEAALRLPDGSPVSGRLRAVLDIDGDDDRETGFDAGALDLRTGAERRLELATRYLGADPDEARVPAVQVTARLVELRKDGTRRTLWRADDSEEERVSWRGDAVEMRVPAARLQLGPRPRLILVAGERALDGRLESGG